MSRPEKEPKTIGEAMANLFSAENPEEKQLAQKELEQLKLSWAEQLRNEGIELTFK